MQDFGLYFNLGREHIADLAGYDHILFVTALCLRYLVQDWKKILVLVTAFTVGHSVTLALSVLDYISISTKWIEFLIPVTIVITALTNVLTSNKQTSSKVYVIYSLALFFGLIHGLGFSNYLKSLLGKDTNIVTELLAFNIGLEVGQLVIVVAVMLLSLICVRLLKIHRRDYLLFASGAIFGIALLMAIERFPN
jgi:cytochrome bd-type quinol oxidase subunit 2